MPVLNLDSPHFARDLRAALDATPRTRACFPTAPVRGPWLREHDYCRYAITGPFAAVPRGERVWLAAVVLLAAVVAVRVLVGLP
jgi:hypothetical protein